MKRGVWKNPHFHIVFAFTFNRFPQTHVAIENVHETIY